jgi:hypothetical protein
MPKIILVNFHYLNNVAGEGENTVNELTMDDYPPYCYLVYQPIEFIPFNDTLYAIKGNGTRGGKCIQNQGY